MRLCGTCHNTNGWRSTNLFDHDFTEFPLVGLHQLVPCESCHVGNQFDGTPAGCVDCHEGDDVHEGGLARQCDQCHTPNAWQLWNFDHDKQTNFSLTGKHTGLTCSACHPANSDPKKTPGFCGSCHRAQDIHRGEFGPDCGRCHSTDDFLQLMFR